MLDWPLDGWVGPLEVLVIALEFVDLNPGGLVQPPKLIELNPTNATHGYNPY